MAVYNAADSVGKMIETLQRQDFDGFEILIIDDGSNDGSGVLCDKYASSDNRIRVIHQVNSGVSASRQRGLDEAQGKYVIHADADDYVEPDMLSRLYDKAKRDEADVVFCDYFIDEPDGTVVQRRQSPPLNPQEALEAMLTKLHGSCWNKLVRREVLLRHNVRFPKGLDYCEDLLTWVQLFKHDDIRISYIDKAFYHYVANPSSVTRSGSKKMLENIRLFTERMAEILPKGEPRIEEYIKTLPIAPFQYAFQHRLVSYKESRKEYKRLRKIIWNDAHSLRWKMGYLMMDLNLMPLAHMLIKL